MTTPLMQMKQERQQPGKHEIPPLIFSSHAIHKQHPLLCFIIIIVVGVVLMFLSSLQLMGSIPAMVDEPKVIVAVAAAVFLLILYFVYSNGDFKNGGETEWQPPTAAAAAAAAASLPPPPPLSLQSSSRCLSLTSCKSESTISDEEDSILAAISMLFIEVEQQPAVEQESETTQHRKQIQTQQQQQQEPPSPSPQSSSPFSTTTTTTTTLDDDSCLTARILPRAYVDYEKRRQENASLFPEQEEFAKMASALRESIEPIIMTQGPLQRAYKTVSILPLDDDDDNVHDEGGADNDAADNDDDELMMIVALDLRLTIPSRCNPNIHHVVHMQLHRHGTEPAVRTLERIEISLSRKLRQEENILASKMNSSNSSSITGVATSAINADDSSQQKSHRALEREQRRKDRKEEKLHEKQQQHQQHQQRFLLAASPPPRTLLEQHINSENHHYHHGDQTACCCSGGSSADSGSYSRGLYSNSTHSNCSRAWSTIWVKDEQKGESDHHTDDGFRLFPLDQQDSATLWKELARHHHQDERIHLQLRSATRRTGSNKGEVMLLHEGDEPANLPPIITLPIYSCPPTILEVDTYEQFTAFVYVGVPLVIETTVLHATRAMIIWFSVEDSVDDNNDDGNSVEGCMQHIKYSPICFDSPIYTPREQDIGKRVGVLIIPMRPGHLGKGQEESFCFQQKVQARPDLPLVYPLRSEWTKPRMMIHNTNYDSNDYDSSAKPRPIRVMTYNLLADLYTVRDIDQQVMYSHCPVKYSDRKRRMPLLLYEILALQPDIVCLQEVDKAVYEHLWRPCLETCTANYQGYYSNKASVQLEGCAMFWSLGCFHHNKPGQYNSYALRDLFSETQQQDGHGNDGDDDWTFSMQGIYRLLDENPQLATVAKEKVGQVLQVAELRLLEAEKHQHHDQRSIVVGNTHLFYHPLADHVRVIQAYMACRQLDVARRHAIGTGATGGCPVILCGDLNSYPLSGTIQLLLQGSVGHGHRETWKHLNDYQWAMGQHEFLLEHGFIGNACDATPVYEDEAFEDALEAEIVSQVEGCISDEDDDDDDYYFVDHFPLNEEYVKAKYVAADRKIKHRKTSSGRAPTIALPDSFPPFISAYQDMPEFTNYAIDFAETLDYILVSSDIDNIEANAQPTLVPRKSAPMPTTCWMKENGAAMPNEFMPSDHVSLVCDLDWVAT